MTVSAVQGLRRLLGRAPATAWRAASKALSPGVKVAGGVPAPHERPRARKGACIPGAWSLRASLSLSSATASWLGLVRSAGDLRGGPRARRSPQPFQPGYLLPSGQCSDREGQPTSRATYLGTCRTHCTLILGGKNKQTNKMEKCALWEWESFVYLFT